MNARPRVLFIAAGGTIAARLDATGNAVPRLTAGDLTAMAPAAHEIADLVPVDIEPKSGRSVTPEDMCSLAHLIKKNVRDGIDGVVVTHGTDTMEETAYALALQRDLRVPLVLTGAMRLPQSPGADGPANLLAALRVAATREATTLGPVIVMQDEIHLARFATKVHTSRIAAFASPGFGPVGSIVEGRVLLHAYRRGSDYLGLPDHITARVEIIWVASGVDGLLVNAATAAAQGLVIAGSGGGHVPPAMAEALQVAINRGLPVVLASRVVGSVMEDTYGGVGSETHLISIGLRPAGLLAPLKARLRLLVALSLGLKAEDVFPV